MTIKESSETMLEGFAGQPLAEQMPDSDDTWLQLSREAWSSGDQWFNSVMRRRVERNLANYSMTHFQGSKYLSDSFQKRSTYFRPRLRTAMRRLVAATAKALFSTEDVVHCTPVNPSREEDRLAAEIHTALLNHRLRTDVPWYKIALGAVTECGINGHTILHQYWDHRKQSRRRVRFEVQNGRPTPVVEYVPKVIHDRPMSEIVPVENFRVAPASDWLDIIGSTPFIVHRVPYFLGELLDNLDSNGVIPYRSVDPRSLLVGADRQYDSIRAKREQDTRDRYADTFATSELEFQVVWVSRNIVRVGDMDWYYETVGDSILLSDPVPLEEVHKIGRPYVHGVMEIEPHTIHPFGLCDLGDQSQAETNEVANLRLDNVKLAMTGRYLVKRGRQTDVRSLMRSVAGGITFTQDVNDVKEIRPPDVTSSSYEEQNRINLDMDDLLGTFSQSTVQSNRALNETVGGMNMLSESASEVMEMNLRNFAETGYQGALRQMAELERHYESNPEIIRIAGAELGMRADEVFRMMDRPVNVEVNIGFGNLNPMMRLQRLQTGITTMEHLSPGTVAKVNQVELAKEVFGALGYKDGRRFLPHLFEEEDPRITQLEEQIQHLTQLVESKQMEVEGRIRVAEISAEARQKIEEMRTAHKERVEAIRSQLRELDIAIRQENNENAKRELAMQREALSHNLLMAERRFELELIQAGLAGQSLEATPVEPTPETGELIRDLRAPGSGAPVPNPMKEMATEATGQPGVASRGNYNAIPFLED